MRRDRARQRASCNVPSIRSLCARPARIRGEGPGKERGPDKPGLVSKPWFGVLRLLQAVHFFAAFLPAFLAAFLVAFLATFLAFFLAAIDLSLFLSWVGIEGGATRRSEPAPDLPN